MSELNMTELTSETFDSFVAEGDSIIFYYKKICPNCKAMKVCFGKVQAQINGFKVGAVDSEEYPDLMAKFEISRVPSFLIYRNGQLRARNTGLMSPPEMRTFIASA